MLGDHDMALARVFWRQPLEISEPEFEVVLAYCCNPVLQPLQADERAGPRFGSHRLPWSMAAASSAATRTSTSSSSNDFAERSRMHWAARARTDAGVVASAISFNSTEAAAPEFC